MVARRLKYEVELNRGFAYELSETPGCERIWDCIQCGTCSATCPLSIYMDYTPRTLIAMVREGFKEEILRSSAIWICSSCYVCTVRCPRGLKVTDFMYALKRYAIEQRVNFKRHPLPTVAAEFRRLVAKYGRNAEGRLSMRVLIKWNPLSVFRLAHLGRRLLLRGRFSLKRDVIQGRHAVRTMLQIIREAPQ